MVEVGHCQRVPVGVEGFSGLSALFAAALTFPANGFLFLKGDAFPIGGIALTFYRHVLPPSADQFPQAIPRNLLLLALYVPNNACPLFR
jgi:hypothetical protein